MNLKLYEIMNEHLEVIEELKTNGAELTPELEAKLNLTEKNLAKKSESIANAILKMEANANEIKERAKHLNDYAKLVDNACKSLKDHFKYELLRIDKRKIETPTARVLLSDTTPSVDVFDINLLPDEYINTKVIKEPSKAKITKALKESKSVAGARFIHNTKIKIT